MVGFTSYNVDNDKRFANTLNKAIKQVGDLRFVMGEISRDIYKTTIQNFILGSSGRYPPLSRNYAKYKQRVKPSAPILVFSGDLRDSVTGVGNSDSIRVIGKRSLIQGTKLPYSRYVQEGTNKMPERKYLFIDNAQAGRFERITANYIEARLQQVGTVK